MAIHLPPLTPRHNPVKVVPDYVGETADHAVRKNPQGIFEYRPKNYNPTSTTYVPNNGQTTKADPFVKRSKTPEPTMKRSTTPEPEKKRAKTPEPSKKRTTPIEQKKTVNKVQRTQTPPASTKPIRYEPTHQPYHQPVVVRERPADQSNRPYVYRRNPPHNKPYNKVKPVQPNPPYVYRPVEKSVEPVPRNVTPIEPVRAQQTKTIIPARVVTPVTYGPEHRYRYRKTAVPQLPYNPKRQLSREREYTYHSTIEDPVSRSSPVNKTPVVQPPIEKRATYTYQDIKVIEDSMQNSYDYTIYNKRQNENKSTQTSFIREERSKVGRSPSPYRENKKQEVERKPVYEEKKNKDNPDKEETETRYVVVYPDRRNDEENFVEKHYTPDPILNEIIVPKKAKEYRSEIRNMSPDENKLPDSFPVEEQKNEEPNQQKEHMYLPPQARLPKPRYNPRKVSPARIVRTPTPELKREPEYVPLSRRFYKVPPRPNDYYRVLELGYDPMVNGYHRNNGPPSNRAGPYQPVSSDNQPRPRYYNGYSPKERSVHTNSLLKPPDRKLPPNDAYSNLNNSRKDPFSNKKQSYEDSTINLKSLFEDLPSNEKKSYNEPYSKRKPLHHNLPKQAPNKDDIKENLDHVTLYPPTRAYGGADPVRVYPPTKFGTSNPPTGRRRSPKQTKAVNNSTHRGYGRPTIEKGQWSYNGQPTKESGVSSNRTHPSNADHPDYNYWTPNGAGAYHDEPHGVNNGPGGSPGRDRKHWISYF